MAASLDGFIARKDGRVDWMETTDEFAAGETMDPAFVAAFLKSIDCYVMGSKTYETALNFEAKGFGWAYGDKPSSFLPPASCRGPAIPSNFTQAILRSSSMDVCARRFAAFGLSEVVPFLANAFASAWPTKFVILSCQS
jgi:hypothetical protein